MGHGVDDSKKYDTPAPAKKPRKWDNISRLNNICEFDYNKITKMFINSEATTFSHDVGYLSIISYTVSVVDKYSRL